jgi:hypothetical protein
VTAPSLPRPRPSAHRLGAPRHARKRDAATTLSSTSQALNPSVSRHRLVQVIRLHLHKLTIQFPLFVGKHPYVGSVSARIADQLGNNMIMEGMLS